MPPAGHALWANVGGGITFVTLGRMLGSSLNCLSACEVLLETHGCEAIYACLSGTARCSMLSANACARFVCYCFGELGVSHLLGFVGAPWSLLCLGDASSAGTFPHSHRAWLRRCAFRWTCFLAEVGGGIIYVTLGEFPGSHKQVLLCFNGGGCHSGKVMLKMLASVGLPSLHGYDACVVYWVKGAFRRNCRLKYGTTSFSPSWVFCLVGIPGRGFGDWEGPAPWATPTPLLSILGLRFSICWGGGLTHWRFSFGGSGWFSCLLLNIG